MRRLPAFCISVLLGWLALVTTSKEYALAKGQKEESIAWLAARFREWIGTQGEAIASD